MSKRKTQEEFIEELSKVNPNVQVLENYVSAHVKILCRCKICNNEWKASPSHLLNNRGCPKCAGNMRKTHEDFVREMYDINQNIIILGKYKGNKSKIACKCNICNYEWEAKAYSLLSNTGCAKCAGNIKKDHNSFIEELDLIQPNIKIIGKYVNCKTKISCECKICKYQWESTPNSLLKGHGCPSCSGVKRYTTNEFISEMEQRNSNIQILGKYVNAKTKILCKCEICQHEWSATGDSLLRGRGCPRCNNSKGEDKIEKYLLSNNIEYIYQKTFDDLLGVNGGLLRFDFYLPTYNFTIEYQGNFHDGTTNGDLQTEEELMIQIEHDKRKREYVKKNNINSLEIWYWDFDNIEKILESRLF